MAAESIQPSLPIGAQNPLIKLLVITCLDALKYCLSFEKKEESEEEDEGSDNSKTKVSQQSKREINDIMHLQTVFKANNASEIIDFCVEFLTKSGAQTPELQYDIWRRCSQSFSSFTFTLTKKMNGRL